MRVDEEQALLEKLDLIERVLPLLHRSILDLIKSSARAAAKVRGD